jgi:hypothetical protein
MEIIPTAFIVRIKNCHFEDIAILDYFTTVEKRLLEKGFKRTELDHFIIMYENPEFTNGNRNTILFVDRADHIVEIKYTVIEME